MTEDLVRPVCEFAAAVFGILFVGAGLAKLEGLPSWTSLLRRFPLPMLAKRILWLGLPLTEITVGVLTFVRPVAGLIASAALLALFAAVLYRHLGLVAGAECRCFGKVSVSTIGPRLIYRNVALSAVAAAAGTGAWIGGASALRPVLIAVVGLLAVLVFLVAEYRSLPRIRTNAEVVPAAQGEAGDG